MVKYVVKFEEKKNPTARLFCIPYSGATVAYYRTWTSLVPADIEMYAVEIPGRLYLKDKPAADMNAIIDTVFPQIAPLLDKPYAIYGHSYGSIISFEIAKRIIKENMKHPVGLFVSGRHAPHLPNRFRPAANLPDQEFIEEINSKYQAIPSEILKEKELLKLLLPGLKRDISMNETYIGKLDPLLNFPVWAYFGTEDISVTKEEIEQWKAVTKDDFKIRAFNGGHFFINKEKGSIITDIAKALQNL
jgi:medium-chain acyl-[acyl-carrier-protein] hydrolase